jgi:hypothetical protein
MAVMPTSFMSLSSLSATCNPTRQSLSQTVGITALSFRGSDPACVPC